MRTPLLDSNGWASGAELILLLHLSLVAFMAIDGGSCSASIVSSHVAELRAYSIRLATK